MQLIHLVLALAACVLPVSSGSTVESNRHTKDVAVDASAAVPRASEQLDGKIDRYMDAATETLDPRVQEALERIPQRDRRLAAMKYYMRHRDQIDDRWAWTAAQVREYRGSDDYRQAMRDIDSVRAEFERENPGYSLSVTTRVRTLRAQLASWNRVASVGRTARELMDLTRWMLCDSCWPAQPDGPGLRMFEDFLVGSETDAQPTVAVPGYSLHGRGHAYDFRVVRGRRLVAGPSTSSIPGRWDAAGWTEKLNRAVTDACDRFDGPLDDPYEPWHYEYMPPTSPPTDSASASQAVQTRTDTSAHTE